MERMKHTGDYELDEINMLEQECQDLEEDNKKLEEENRKLKSEIENMKEVGRENIETLDRMSAELENYSKSFKRYRDFSKQELADSLYDIEEENRKLKLHIEAKDKAYTSLLKDYEELKEDRKKILDEIEAEIERFKDFRKSLEK